jgi:SAM-dependent methyltransferase
MATGNDEDHCSTISGSKAAKLYASIAVDYNAAKSNPFKQYVEESSFSSVIGPSSSLHGQQVLDLGCGSGHYCRILKNKLGASTIHGVDVSEHMLAEARRHEAQAPLGIQYMQQDLLSCTAAAKIMDKFNNSDLYDLVTAEYLFPYAANREELDQLCLNAASLVKSGGGRFATIVSLCSDSVMSAGIDGILESKELGWAVTWNDEPKDGMLVEFTLFGDTEGCTSRVSFPNYLWTKETIYAALKAAGFGQVEWGPVAVADGAPEFIKRANAEVEKTPIGIVVARRF